MGSIQPAADKLRALAVEQAGGFSHAVIIE